MKINEKIIQEDMKRVFGFQYKKMWVRLDNAGTTIIDDIYEVYTFLDHVCMNTLQAIEKLPYVRKITTVSLKNFQITIHIQIKKECV